MSHSLLDCNSRRAFFAKQNAIPVCRYDLHTKKYKSHKQVLHFSLQLRIPTFFQGYTFYHLLNFFYFSFCFKLFKFLCCFWAGEVAEIPGFCWNILINTFCFFKRFISAYNCICEKLFFICCLEVCYKCFCFLICIAYYIDRIIRWCLFYDCIKVCCFGI